MANVEFVCAEISLALEGDERFAFEANLQGQLTEPIAWFRVDDGGGLTKRALRSPRFTLYFAEFEPGCHEAYRLETGLAAGDSREIIPQLSAAFLTWSGSLKGVYRGIDGADVPVPPHLLRACERADPPTHPPADALPHLPMAPLMQPTQPPRGDSLAEKAADATADPQALSALVGERRLAPYLVQNPRLRRRDAESLLEALLKRGPWECVHALARHSVWGVDLPASLRRSPFIHLLSRRELHARMADTGAPMEERIKALERLFGWSCEVDLDSLNVAPWLPAESPEAVIEAFIQRALDVDEALDELFDDAFEDDVACWSLPPRMPSSFQRLLAAWRHPRLSNPLRHQVFTGLERCRLSPAMEQALGL